MAPRISHAKVSSRPAGNDPGRVYGPDWNADHVIEGLAIGTDVQAHNAGLDNLSALDATPGVVVETAANTFAKRTLTGASNRIAVTNGDGSAGNPTVDIHSGYVGQTTITTVGTISTGTWQGTRFALTKTDDTNVTLTLGGTPASALLAATSVTVGWSGTLAAGRLNANVVQAVTNDTNVTGAIAAQNLTLGWSGVLSGARGGTGVNNGAGTITIGGNFSTAGAAALPAIAQGDLWYGSASGVKSALAKNTSASRYLANTGTSNNPAWDQVNLGNGVTGTLAIASGGTAQTSAAAARGSGGLNVDSFTGHGDSNYTISATDKVVGTNASLTASRTWTLPAANAVNPGQPLVVADFQGSVTATNTLVVSRAGADTLNGGTSVTINGANGAYILWSDGTSKWTAQAIGAAASSGVSTFSGRSGAVTPAQGDYTANLIAGTATNDNATAGNIGEYVEAKIVSGSAIPMTSSAVLNVTSISLSPGDWDVCGVTTVSWNNTSAVNFQQAAISIVSATLPSHGLSGFATTWLSTSGTNLPIIDVNTGVSRLSLGSVTTVYLVGLGSWSTGGNSMYGEIRARRVR